jgi:hypothetical protein
MKNLKLLLESLQDAIPEHITLNQALIKTLKINKDAASRRINGKTPFTYDEVCALSKAYGINLMPAQSSQHSNIVFGYVPFKSKHVDSKHFFQTISSLLQEMASLKNSCLYHVAPEVPIYHCYNYPKLLNFRLFYWGKYLLNNPYYTKRVFNEAGIDAEITKHARKAYENLDTTVDSEHPLATVLLHRDRRLRQPGGSGICCGRTLGNDAAHQTNGGRK